MVKSLMVNLENKFFPQISDKQVKVVILITIPFLLVDSLINTVSDFLVHQTTSIWGISFFVIVSIVYAVSQQLLLRFVWSKTKDIRSKSLAIRRLLTTITVAQYSLLGILIIILYQSTIYVTLQYESPNLVNCNKPFNVYISAWFPSQAIVLVVQIK